jgi:hypothetical protein
MPRKKSYSIPVTIPEKRDYERSLVVKFLDANDPIVATRTTFDFTRFARHKVAATALARAFRVYHRDHVGTMTQYMGFQNLYPFFKFLDERTAVHGELITTRDLDGDLLLEYGAWLSRTYDGQAIRSSFQRFSVVRKLLVQAAQLEGRSFPAVRSPFQHVNASSNTKRQLSPTEYQRVLDSARKEAYSYWRAFQKYKQDEYLPNDERYLAQYIRSRLSGVCANISKRSFAQNGKLYSLFRSLGGERELAPRFHATFRSLVPFMILIAQRTMANAESLRTFERNCMTPIPLLKNAYVVTWSKKRSKDMQHCTATDNGFWSLPRLIYMVQCMTDPLRHEAQEYVRPYLFIAPRSVNRTGITVPTAQSIGANLDYFAQDNSLLDDDARPLNLNLDMIRPTEMNHDYLLRGDILALQRRAGHRYLSTTFGYVVSRRTADQHDRTIAKAQTKLQAAIVAGHIRAPATNTRRAPNKLTQRTLNAADVSHICRNPYKSKLAPGKLCPAWLSALTDVGLIIPPVPIYLARVLQLSDALREAQGQMNGARFEALYKPHQEMISKEILPAFSATQISAARELLPTLPSLPDLSQE